jgi:RNA polymerase sigma-B factor
MASTFGVKVMTSASVLSVRIVPDEDATRALFECYHRTHDRLVRDQLTELHFGLAQSLARRFRDRGESHDDLLQVASLGLLKAIERFEPARGMQFSTYAVPTIIGELKRHFRDKTWLVRVPRSLQEFHLEIRHLTEDLTHELGCSPTAAQIADRAGCGVDEVLAAIDAGNAYRGTSLDAPATSEDSGTTAADQLAEVDPDLETVGDREEIRELLAVLDARERQIVTLRFFDGLTQRQIAKRLGISQMQVSRLLGRALATMRAQASGSANQDDLSSVRR